MKKSILAVFVLISTIVGVGMFGIPYTAAQSGFLIAAVFLCLLTAIMILLHLFYGEIVFKTKDKHRLPGYAGLYLGERMKKIIGAFVIFGFYGSLLVYIVVGGNFLRVILSPLIDLPFFVFNLLFFIIGATVVYFGLRIISRLDILMGLFLVLIVFLFLYFGLGHINSDNFKFINLKNVFMPYGVILYSLAGMAAIPEIRELFNRDKRPYKKAIFIGTLIPAILYFIFMMIIIGISGEKTSEEAIGGLTGILGNKIVLLGAIFGFFATITSFFTLGLSLKSSFHYDFKINKNLAWFLVCFVPIILFFLGLHNFVWVIVLLGAVMGMVECSSIVLIYGKLKEAKPFKLVRTIMIIVFVAGFLYTMISLIKH